jgi:diguanylate cyclase (GGDEF)-like protein
LNIDNNKQVGAMLILNDITEKKYYELNLIEDADKDSLTQLFNRRGFMTHYGIVLDDAVEHSKPVSVIMIDIDHFKRINDSFGHIKGDKVLQNLAAILRDTLREEDIIGRIGGEEFAVVLPKINKNDAFIVAERIRRRVQEGGVLIQDDLTINYTVSIGVNDNTGADTTIEQLLHNADMALYEAKKQSRNYTLVHDSYLLNQNEVV